MIDLDDTDLAILRALAQDATQPASTLGRQLGLSQPATWRRIKRLEEGGAIAGRRLRLNAEALGFGVTVFLGIKLATRGRVSLEDSPVKERTPAPCFLLAGQGAEAQWCSIVR